MHQSEINAKAAFDGDVRQWHQDYGVWPRDSLMPECRAMNIALFLDDVTEFNGTLMFIPPSHRKGTLEAGRDVETTSYPLRTTDNATIARLVAEGGLVASKGPAGSLVLFSGNLSARQSGQYVALRPHHRLPEPVPGGQPHPPLQAAGMGRPPRFHPHRMPRRRLPVQPRPQGGVEA